MNYPILVVNTKFVTSPRISKKFEHFLHVIVPYTARVQDFDTMLGGHKIPSGTPVVEALGVVMNDETSLSCSL